MFLQYVTHHMVPATYLRLLLEDTSLLEGWTSSFLLHNPTCTQTVPAECLAWERHSINAGQITEELYFFSLKINRNS
jgi:hypothetical protein